MPIAPEHLALAYTGPFNAYLYGRASVDPNKKGRSVASQLGAGRTLCHDNGWPIVAEFKDVDRSASRYAKRGRERFEEMIEGIEAGRCRILVAWEASRYYRDLEVYLRLRNACMAAGVLLCYNGAVYDLSKRGDRKLTAQDALQAEDEADGIRDRNLRTMRTNAAEGRPHGRLLYGYARRYDPDTGDLIEQYPHPKQSPIVAEIFERVAAGETEYSIIQDLQTRGDRVPGVKWQQYHLSNMLRNPSYMGHRVFQGKDIGPGNWKGIVEEDLFERVQRIVKNPARLTTKDWSVKHLLSGIGRCGECPTWPPLRMLNNRGIISYQCDENYDTVISEAKLDAYVEEAVIEYLGSKAAIAAFRSTDDEKRAEQARALHGRLTTQLKEARKAATTVREDGSLALSVDSLGAMESSLTPQIEKAKEQMEAFTAPPVLRGLIGRENVDELWDDMTIDQRRSVLRAVVNVRLFKARARGVTRIEPGRVQLTFLGEPGFIREWRRGREKSPVPAE
ncbi:recombinase family protein [Streptomyces niveus]|uniref:recombinase family protein n=1 Tax=Streptomyces niveus TaxID=193462 RepID=UPI0003C5D07D|nr:recombinase family protein [Streptomyces niveus]EST22824.1 hypothetical protein M877_29035 [Streptomyces niveus NCIMB 11891]